MSWIKHHSLRGRCRGEGCVAIAAMASPTRPAVATPGAADAGRGPAPAFSPLYRQIKELLTQSLQGGEWRPGEAIPSEVELAARFKVSQGTVRKAIDALADENLLVRRQGKGTFVATHAEERVQFRFLRLMPDDGEVGGMARRCSAWSGCRSPMATGRSSCGAACTTPRRTITATSSTDLRQVEGRQRRATLAPGQ
jgi:DNA-binding transcriptional regulator YhcF (GntR family)